MLRLAKRGGKALMGGYFYEEGDCKKGFFYMPTIFTEGHPSMRIAQEEIFGPVVLIMPVNSFEGGNRSDKQHKLWPIIFCLYKRY